MPTVENLKRRLFWIVSRLCFTLYRRFPLFGSLRASVAIIRRDAEILVIERNDGRGLCLPGGIAGWKESEEDALRREVEEETGLTVISHASRMRYHSTVDVPCTISVFEVQATGELKGSWEGSPRWMAIGELGPRLLRSQHPVLELLGAVSAEARPASGARGM